MRITTYATELDSDRKNILVKESSSNYPDIDRLDSPEKVANILNGVFHAKAKAEEHLWLIALDNKCKPIGVFEVSHGTVNSSAISPREIFVRLCLCGAANCILAHNHPSGDATPSQDDINATSRIKEAGELMDIRLLDHVIIGQEYYSFREQSTLF